MGLDRAGAALIEGRFEDARAALDGAAATLGCAAVEPRVLARFWQTDGALSVAEGDPAGAVLALAAARRVAPDWFDDGLGLRVRDLWTDAGDPPGRGHVALKPDPVSFRGLLDTHEATWPATVGAGLHLVQVASPDGVVFGAIVRVVDGELIAVPTGLSEQRAAVGPVEPAVVRRRPPVLGVLGGVALASGAASLAGWAVSDGQLRGSGTPEQARRAQDRKMAFGAAGLSLSVVGALGVAGEIAF